MAGNEDEGVVSLCKLRASTIRKQRMHKRKWQQEVARKFTMHLPKTSSVPQMTSVRVFQSRVHTLKRQQFVVQCAFPLKSESQGFSVLQRLKMQPVAKHASHHSQAFVTNCGLYLTDGGLIRMGRSIKEVIDTVGTNAVACVVSLFTYGSRVKFSTTSIRKVVSNLLEDARREDFVMPKHKWGVGCSLRGSTKLSYRKDVPTNQKHIDMMPVGVEKPQPISKQLSTIKTPLVSAKNPSNRDFVRQASYKAACKRLKYKTLFSEIDGEDHKCNSNTKERSISLNFVLSNAATNSRSTQRRAAPKIVGEDIPNEHKTNKKTHKLAVSSNLLLSGRNQTGPSTLKNKTVGVIVRDNLSERYTIHKNSVLKSVPSKPLSQNLNHNSVCPSKTNDRLQLVWEDSTEKQVCKILSVNQLSSQSFGCNKNPVRSRTLELVSSVVAFDAYDSSSKNEVFVHRSSRFCTSSSNKLQNKSTSINEEIPHIKASMFKVSDLPKLVVMPLLNSQQAGKTVANVTPLSQNDYLSKSHTFVSLRNEIQSFGWLNDEKHSISHPLPEVRGSGYPQANVETTGNLLSEVISSSVIQKSSAKSSVAQYRILSTSITYVYTGEGSRSIRFLPSGKSSWGLL